MLMWAAGAALVWVIRGTYLRLRPWHAVDWHAIGDAVGAHPLGVAVTLVALTLLPLLLGAAFELRAPLYWGVLAAYTGISWAVPAVFVWLDVDRRLRERGVGHRKLYAVTAAVLAGIGLLVAVGAIIDAFDPTV